MQEDPKNAVQTRLEGTSIALENVDALPKSILIIPSD
jgi:hypothetical protein